jgi:hypothetical protein
VSAKVAIELFHGRTSPDQHLDTWGSQGPVFLVDYVHVTYLCEIKLGIPEPAGDGDLRFVEDLVYYDGIFYGDWSVFPAELAASDPNLTARTTSFDPAKAALPSPQPSRRST